MKLGHHIRISPSYINEELIRKDLVYESEWLLTRNSERTDEQSEIGNEVRVPFFIDVLIRSSAPATTMTSTLDDNGVGTSSAHVIFQEHDESDAGDFVCILADILDGCSLSKSDLSLPASVNNGQIIISQLTFPTYDGRLKVRMGTTNHTT